MSNNLFIFLEKLLPIFQSPEGIIFFIPFCAAWVTFLLPGLWISMLAGALYGTWLGSLIVFIGAVLGAEITFLLGRTLFRERIKRSLAKLPKLEIVVKAVSKEGLRLVFLTRLSPAFPFSLLNFAYGLSDISFRDYTIGLIAILPGTILFCGLGNVAGDLFRFSDVLKDQESFQSLFLTIVGFMATFAVFLLATNTAKKALSEIESIN